MQHEITKPTELLDANGCLKEPGYAKKNFFMYDRSKIKANRLRIKEWDYYLVYNNRFAVALTIADNNYMGLDSVSFLQFDPACEKTVSIMQVMPGGKKKLPASSGSGDVSVQYPNASISFRHGPVAGERILEFNIKNFDGGKPFWGKITLSEEPDESMTIATPFDKKAHFYYNQKINCMRADGFVNYLGKEYLFKNEDSFGVLDWGRGVWTYRNTWIWGSGSGQIDGILFGFNIGYGFGDTSAATENMLFYNGKASKLNQVMCRIPQKSGRDDYLKPWSITSDDGRFEMEFVPVLDRASCVNLGVLKSDQHQVFGRFNGKAVQDDGTVIAVKDFMGFVEKVFNKW